MTEYCVLHGGSYFLPEKYIRCTSFNYDNRCSGYTTMGIRLVRRRNDI